MKALSIRQPYAFAIACGFKPVENRSWRHDFRGQCLIHAGKQPIREAETPVLQQIADQTKLPLTKVHALYRERAGFGAIVGRAIVTDCVDRHASRWFFGPHAFVMREAEYCVPFPFRGALSFFDVPDSIIERLQFSRAAEAASGDLFGGV